MCRHVAYLGPRVPLGELVLSGTHSLVHQAYRPRELITGVVCADGFGVGWYDEHGTPARYRSSMPIWSDVNLPEIAPAVRSDLVVAMVRNATPGMPFGEAAVHPFRHGSWLFVHNGSVRDPDGAFLRELRAQAPLDAPFGGTDSSDLFGALLADLLAGTDAADAVVRLVERVAATELAAWLNFLLTDGERLIATRWAAAGPHPSLYLDATAERVRIASEPLDGDGGWEEVPPGSLLDVDRRLEPRSAPLPTA